MDKSVKREHVLREIHELLVNNGFETSHIYERSCFDLMARRKLLLLLLKVLVNIDGINSLQAHEIKTLAHTFLASPLLIGIRSKTEYLEEDVVYERHGIPVVAPETFRNIVVDGECPEVIADRGGYYVHIDGRTLKEVREEYRLSLKDLADLAHVSRKTIYKYENGLARASAETAMVLEELLNVRITLSIDIFSVPERGDVEIKPSGRLGDIGFGMIETQRTPFDAVAKEMEFERTVITDLEKGRDSRTLRRMAVPLRDLSLISGSESVFIIDSPRIRENLEGVPVIKSWEINDMESSRDFLKVIAERRTCS
ncbi:transcriptional regulator [Methanothermobacter sp.]|uniref:transcriptional regulator n=1 Tax=Methanothermobacter sp. TaxID=1884223 RepID=UPI003C736619